MNLTDIFRPDPIPHYYSNHVEVGHNKVEMRVRFNFVYNIADTKAIVEIALPPVIAKAFMNLLDEQIKSYETNIGPIYMPDDKSGLEQLFGSRIEEESNE